MPDDASGRAQAVLASLQQALSGARQGLWEWDLRTEEARYSAEWQAMLGYAQGEVEPTVDAWRGLIHPADRAHAAALLGAHVAGRTSLLDVEHRLRQQDGSYRWTRMLGVAVEDGGGARLVGMMEDVSRAKDVETRLLDLTRLHEETVEHVPAGVMHLAPDGAILHRNQRLLGMLGDAAPEVQVANVFESGLVRDNSHLTARLRRLLEGEPFEDVQVVVRLATQRRLLLSLSGVPVADRARHAPGADAETGAEGRALHPARSAVLLARDVTAQTEAETRLRSLTVARPLVRSIVRGLIDKGGVDKEALTAVGRELASQTDVSDLPSLVRAFSEMGLGVLEIDSSVGGTHTFTGRDLIERRSGARLNTCFLTLGFLTGVVERAADGERALGTETSCQSRGDETCRFVVRARR